MTRAVQGLAKQIRGKCVQAICRVQGLGFVHDLRQVLENLAAAEKAKGPLRDHRSLCCHLDDHLRICAIPRRKGASFRDMQGVVTHADSESFNAHSPLERAPALSNNIWNCAGLGTVLLNCQLPMRLCGDDSRVTVAPDLWLQ